MVRRLGSFRIFGSWAGLELGLFRIFGVWSGREDGGGAGIGFVSHEYGAVGHLVCGNWVRFVFLGFHRSAAVEIGFVSYFLAVGCWRLAVGLVELGSFCAFGSWSGGRLGSFRVFWLLAVGFWQLALWNWVCFGPPRRICASLRHFGRGPGGGLVSQRIGRI